MIEPFTSTRQANKEKRRRRILDAARRILTDKGYDALNSRDLAKAAGVTTPTLYNLVGTKAEVLTALSLESVDELEVMLNRINADDALQFIEGIVLESRKMLEADDSFFRGSMIAMHQLSTTAGGHTAERNYAQRCIEVAIHGCERARDQGLLLGNIPAALLGEQLFAVYSAPWREWVYNRLSLDDFGIRVLRGFYMSLCSDATPVFLERLRAKIKALPAELPTKEGDLKNKRGKKSGT